MAQTNNWNKTNQWEEEIELLHSLIARTELQTEIKWGGPVFTLNKKSVIGVGGFKSYFGLWFYNGVFLKDVQQKLVSANEETKALRQWRFASKQEILENEPLILEYIQEAIANEKAGFALKPVKKETVISDFFQHKFDSDFELSTAFQGFSPSKQREFLEHIDSAKQEKTKLARWEKIEPMIRQGIGLHDKYR